MSKILLTLNNISNYIEDNKFYMEKNMILSSSVKDYLAEKNIEIIYKKACDSKDSCSYEMKNISKEERVDTSKEESLSQKIERILKEEYKISDKNIVDLILKRINQGGK